MTEASKHFQTRYALGIINGLQRKPLYEGTVGVEERARRRAKGKRAKAARKAQRR
ncbi:hypothetical protein [Rhodococcus sp. 11-3]|uniref:hypothetical protein n=1 Tax=Rhodococcus sp. 11-3 TaxID=2854796 RepID=UPI00203BA303|nr:hypothetical protein [Rhodococcus sp. 11-3]USC16975.1 hypothetical protein KZJ41_08970 [Rhodococcus sp. 11-3]